MPNPGFLSFFLVLAVGGFLSALSPARYLKPALFLVLVGPSEWIFSGTMRWKGIYAVDGFYLGLALGLVLFLGAGHGPELRGKVPWKSFGLVALALIFLIVHHNGQFSWRAFLLDTRFLFVSLEVMLLVMVVELDSWNAEDRMIFLGRVVLVNGLLDGLIFTARLGSEGVSGILTRYYDPATILAIFWLCYFWRPSLRRFSLVDLGALISLVASGSRFYLLLVLLWQIKNFLRGVSPPAVKIFGTGGVLAALYIIAAIWGNIDVNRSMHPEILVQHMGMRFFPFIWEWVKMGWEARIIGLGSGTLFFIPWFTYWGRNPWNIYMDSLYATALIKFGLLFGPLLIGLLFSALAKAKISFRGIYPWLAALGLTQSLLWQHHIHTILLIGAIATPLLNGRLKSGKDAPLESC